MSFCIQSPWGFGYLIQNFSQSLYMWLLACTQRPIHVHVCNGWNSQLGDQPSVHYTCMYNEQQVSQTPCHVRNVKPIPTTQSPIYEYNVKHINLFFPWAIGKKTYMYMYLTFTPWERAGGPEAKGSSKTCSSGSALNSWRINYRINK